MGVKGILERATPKVEFHDSGNSFTLPNTSNIQQAVAKGASATLTASKLVETDANKQLVSSSVSSAALASHPHQDVNTTASPSFTNLTTTTNSLADASVKLSNMLIQPIATNNLLVGENLYYATSEWKNRLAGYGNSIQYSNGNFYFYTSPNTAANTAVTPTNVFAISNAGLVGIGKVPDTVLNVKSRTAVAAEVRIDTTDTAGASADAKIGLYENAVRKWEIYNDGSDSDILKVDRQGVNILKVADTGIDVASGNLLLAGTAVTSTAAELNILDGALCTYDDLNFLQSIGKFYIYCFDNNAIDTTRWTSTIT